MANEITRLLPFRQYDENDVINFYSYDLETGEAGSVVRVSDANLSNEPVKYVERTDANSYDNTLGNALSLYPETPYKVTKVSDTGAGVRPLGILPFLLIMEPLAVLRELLQTITNITHTPLVSLLPLVFVSLALQRMRSLAHMQFLNSTANILRS